VVAERKPSSVLETRTAGTDPHAPAARGHYQYANLTGSTSLPDRCIIDDAIRSILVILSDFSVRLVQSYQAFANHTMCRADPRFAQVRDAVVFSAFRARLLLRAGLTGDWFNPDPRDWAYAPIHPLYCHANPIYLGCRSDEYRRSDFGSHSPSACYDSVGWYDRGRPPGLIAAGPDQKPRYHYKLINPAEDTEFPIPAGVLRRVTQTLQFLRLHPKESPCVSDSLTNHRCKR